MYYINIINMYIYIYIYIYVCITASGVFLVRDSSSPGLLRESIGQQMSVGSGIASQSAWFRFSMV